MADASTTLPVTEEQLEISRQTVDSGGRVRVSKVVEEEPVQLDTPVARETVHVTRVPIGRVVQTAPSVREEGDVTVIPVIEERVVTTKELVLVEEVRLTRRREETVAREATTVRRERVVVERFDPDTGEWRAEAN